MSYGGTHHTALTAEQGFWVGTKASKTQIINSQGQLLSALPANTIVGTSHSILPMVKVDYTRVQFNTPDLATGVSIRELKPTEILLGIYARVTEAWDSAVSAVVSIGHGGGLNQYINAQNVKVLGLVPVVAGSLPAAWITADTDVKVKVVTDGATTKGILEVTMLYAIVS